MVINPSIQSGFVVLLLLVIQLIGVNTTQAQMKRWSDAATWEGNSPQAGQDVMIPVGDTILLDVDNLQLGKLDVRGVLMAGPNNIQLTAKEISFEEGVFEIGSIESPYAHLAVITLTNAASVDLEAISTGNVPIQIFLNNADPITEASGIFIRPLGNRSVGKEMAAKPLELMPNPVKSNGSVRLKGLPDGRLKWELNQIDGTQLAQGELADNERTIKGKRWPEGTYLLWISDYRNRKRWIGKLLVQ